MRIRPLVIHFHDGVNVIGGVYQSISVTGNGGAHKVDDMEATPVGVLIRNGSTTSLVPWASIKSAPQVEVVDDKPGKGKP